MVYDSSKKSYSQVSWTFISPNHDHKILRGQKVRLGDRHFSRQNLEFNNATQAALHKTCATASPRRAILSATPFIAVSDGPIHHYTAAPLFPTYTNRIGIVSSFSRSN